MFVAININKQFNVLAMLNEMLDEWEINSHVGVQFVIEFEVGVHEGEGGLFA